MTNIQVVGVGDCKVSNDPDAALITYALGSCIAVLVHDPVARVGGLLHFMLPEGSIDPVKAERTPFLFADTGIPILFHSVFASGGDKRRLVVSLAGGAQMLDDKGVFNIGKRNYLAARKALWKAGIMVRAEDVGGLASRTVRLEVATGKITLRGPQASENRPLAALTLGKEPSNGIRRSDRR